MKVAEGEGQAIVICVGNSSMFGKTMAGLAKEQEPTPLQHRLEETGTAAQSVQLLIKCFIKKHIQSMSLVYCNVTRIF